MHPSLKSIELNITNKCNRSCLFCPQSQGFGGTDFMSPDIAKIVDSQLGEDYSGRITLSGFGEPLLNPHLEDIIKSIEYWNVILITNGDAITKKRVDSLIDAGLKKIRISLYDDSNLKNIHECLNGKIRYSILDYTTSPIHIVNRNEIYNKVEASTDSLKCYIPSYKMFIDWDGEVRLCANDWRGVLSFGNIYKTPINDIWLSKEFNKYRFKNRTETPCNVCKVNGTMRGKESYKELLCIKS